MAAGLIFTMGSARGGLNIKNSKNEVRVTKIAQIPARESLHIEFKQEQVSSKDLADEIVAFSNGEGGEIWLGVDDQGKLTGISRNYEEDIMNICRTAVIPPVQPIYEEISLIERSAILTARLSLRSFLPLQSGHTLLPIYFM